MARRSSLVLQRRPSNAIVRPFCGREQWMLKYDDCARTAMEYANFIH